MVSDAGKPGFKGSYLLPLLFPQPVLISRIESQRSRWSQLDVLWGSWWLWLVGKHTSGGNGKQEHSWDER